MFRSVLADREEDPYTNDTVVLTHGQEQTLRSETLNSANAELTAAPREFPEDVAICAILRAIISSSPKCSMKSD